MSLGLNGLTLAFGLLILYFQNKCFIRGSKDKKLAKAQGCFS